jgi:tRNA1(Val) A37 N6-methylase TrmN6
VTAGLAAEGAADPAVENVGGHVGEHAAENGFLDGRVRIRQPLRGYRAATDAVLLAAAVPAGPADAVLDLGCGAGTAALCLGCRVGGVELHGLELQPGYAGLARENAALNGRALAVHEGDLRAMPSALRHRSFDAVMLNPPWHAPAHPGSPDAGRDIANRRGAATIGDWIDAALARTRPGGTVVVIMLAEGLPEILAALGGRAASAVLPLAARPGRDAKRVIVRARKGGRAPFRLAPPLILHCGVAHIADGDDYTPQARAILREAAALEF